MTEAEWESCIDRERMLEFLHVRISTRKLRLFAVACCRQQWETFPTTPHRTVINAAERFADGSGAEEELQVLSQPSLRSLSGAASRITLTREQRHLASAAYGTAANGNEFIPFWRVMLGAAQSVSEAVAARLGDYTAEFLDSDREVFPQITMLHDIAGNPFYPEAVESDWLTPTVVQIATGMYESRDFGAMPVLADALQDAGCDNDIILDHCRGRWPHVRGCWVVDLVLGKE